METTMKKIRRLFLLLSLITAGAQSAWAASTHPGAKYLETVTDSKGITYEIFQEGVIFNYAWITHIESNETSLEIPGKVAMSNGSLAIVRGFDSSFTCHCPYITSLYLKECCYFGNGVVCGNFAGMYNLTSISFYSQEGSTSISWTLDPSTVFVKNINVFLTELVEHGGFQTVNGPVIRDYYDDHSIPATWKSHANVDKVYCTYRYRDDKGIGYTPCGGGSNFEATVIHFPNNYDGRLFIPEYVRTDNGERWKVTRVGYPDVELRLQYKRLPCIEFFGDITIDENVDFTYCLGADTLVFDGKVAIPTKPIWSSPLRVVEFHGDVDMCPFAFANAENLEKVYFYDGIPELKYYNLSDYFDDDITFYVNMSIWEIEEYKTAHPGCENLNIQPIDPSYNYIKLTVENKGPGEVTIRGEKDNSLVYYNVKGYATTTLSFDKGKTLSVWEANGTADYGVSGTVLNDTLNIPVHYAISLPAARNTLKILYYQKAHTDGTKYNIHFSMEGNGRVFLTNDVDENYAVWYYYGANQEEIADLPPLFDELNSEVNEFDCTCEWWEYKNMYIYFGVGYRAPHNGVVETVRVMANGVPITPYSEGGESEANGIVYNSSFYEVPITGDMDIQFIFETNARLLQMSNDVGGNMYLMIPGNSTAATSVGDSELRTIELGKNSNGRILVMPKAGKKVSAIYTSAPISPDETVTLSPDPYLTSEGFYGIPLTGFDEGTGLYRVTVVYADKPAMLFGVGVAGEGEATWSLCEGDTLDYSSVQSITASESTGRNLTGNLYNDELKDNNFIEYQLTPPQKGNSLKVYWEGYDVTSIFKPNSSGKLYAYLGSGGMHDIGPLMPSSLMAIYEPATDIIEFADDNVKNICVANWDTNGDGELSKEEAAAVTTLRVMNEDMTVYASPFKNNAEIISFDELQYFTGLTEIADSAFYRCQTLQSVVVPNTLKIIKAYSFYYSPALTSVRLPEGLQKIGDFAFAVCTTLSNIHIPSTVTSLGTQAFSQCYALKQVIIPENVSKATHVFSNCRGLLSIFIPKNVTDIGSLSGCSSLTSIAVEPGNTVYDSRNGCNALIRTADNTLLHGCATTQIPEDIKTISGFAFAESRIETIDIPNGVETISGYAFQNCSMLTSVTIPESVTSIGNYTFYGCSRLKTVVSKIKEPFAFGTNCFSPALRKLIVPAGTRDAYIAAGWTENIFRDGIEEAPEDNSRYDLNGDDEVDIADVTKLVNMVLGNDQPSSNP